MLQRIPNIPTFGLFLILLAGLFILPSAEGIAKKKKAAYYKKVKGYKKGKRHHRTVCLGTGREQAMDILRSDASPELMMLAGMNADDATAPNRERPAQAKAQSEQEQLAMEGENIAELEKEDDIQVDIESFKSLWLSYVDPTGSDKDQEMLTCGIAKSQLMDAIMDWLGTRYHFGGTSRQGIDCSAFVRTVFAQSGNITLPRTAQTQIDVGRPVQRVSELQFGDLIFFHTMNHAYVSHVGIYLGDNLFAHASSRYGVTISSLQSTYYATRIIGARRLTSNDMQMLAGKSEDIVTR